MNYLLKLLLSFGLLLSVYINSFAEDKFDTLSDRVSELEKRINLLSYGLSKLSKSSAQPNGSNFVKSSNLTDNIENETSKEIISDEFDQPLSDSFSVQTGENEGGNYSSIREKYKSENYSTANSNLQRDTSSSTSDNMNNFSYTRSSNSGVIGSDYVGIGFTNAWNNDFDVTHQEVYIEARKPLLEILDLNGQVEIAVSDIEGGPNILYFDGLGNSFYLPKHNRWSVGASLGLDLHYEFSFSDSFSVDPFVGAGLPLDYYFTTEYEVYSEIRYGYRLSFGVEFLLFDSLSIIPVYNSSTFSYLRDDGFSWTAESRGSFSLTTSYFFSNSFLSLALYKESDVNWKGWSLSYNLGY